jgi:hypothetical protein
MTRRLTHDLLAAFARWADDGRFARLALALAIAILSQQAIGCRRSDMVPVSGRVTFEGRPVPQAVVRFLHDSRPMAAGGTDADGRYRLTTRQPGDGAYLGRCKVLIAPWVAAPGDSSEDPAEPVRPDIPKVFRVPASSPLAVEVTPEGPNQFDFELAKETAAKR